MPQKIHLRAQFFGRVKTGRRPSHGMQDAGGAPLRLTRMFPMKLKDVKLNELKDLRDNKTTACLDEMISLLDCLELHEFNKDQCSTQVTSLEQCHSAHAAELKRKKLASRQVRESK